MTYPKDKKLVIAIASSALFDLEESDRIFREQGTESYRRYQEENIEKVLGKGVAFPFVKRFLSLNEAFPNAVDVVLLSRNSPETGLRVFRSIEHYGLKIVRAAFFSGKSPFEYIPAFHASLFLSANQTDVKKAIDAGIAAGQVLKTDIQDDDSERELRVAFDFDGVIADDASETIYKTQGMDSFLRYEKEKRFEPHHPGPLKDLFEKISYFQSLEIRRQEKDPSYRRILKVAIVTARSAPSHERMIRTLKDWNIEVDEAFFLGGNSKKDVLEVMQPHLFFDDQQIHLSGIDNIPLVHIPFGIANLSPSKV